MKRKWEYIAERCEEDGNYQAADIAAEIDEVLSDLYNDEHTKSWISEYRFLKMKSVSDIAGDSSSCVACVKHDDDCLQCLFADKVGMCIIDDEDETSLFDDFLNVLKDEY